jgi:asparagine synthase (glutamine-hydrolysing)
MLVSAARRHLPGPVRRQVIGRLAAIYPKLDRAPRFLRAKHTLTELSLDSAEGYARTATRSHAAQRHALFSPRLRAAIAGHDPLTPLRTVMEAASEADPLLQAQLADLATWLPGDILTKVDRASMAASLEVRAPFLDHEFLSWGLSLPASLKIGAGGGKHILKKALEPLLPREVLYRPKQGFTSDMAKLFRAEMDRVRALLLGPVMLESGLFDGVAITRLLDAHASGAADHAQVIWLLLAFEGFLASLAALPEARSRVLAAV